MENFLNKWFYFEILYYKSDFQEINNLDFVHPDDREFVKNNLTNTIYRCIGIEDEYLIAKSRKYTLRVKPKVIKGHLPTPRFIWGDMVYEKAKPDVPAVINDFFWHHKDQRYYYHITVNGKKKSKRYSENELMPRCSH
ncbi:MAG: hypothetical protein VXW38_07540 [Bacteroidota bacterium]|nr:hypothetical protein [Bacteroidota bacterium]